MSSEGLRIVLFGAAGAGKTSLLGALAQAAQSQEQALGGKLSEPAGGLAQLRKSTYESKPPETKDETVSYDITLETAEAVSATLIDCDGRLAQGYLDGTLSLDARTRLAQAIKDADALILAVAADDPGRLEPSFQEFARFLKLFEQRRGARSEIGGLPVYLVLTKCDLLPRKDDTEAEWLKKIDDRKRKITEGFREFLDRATSVPFGVIDFHPWATAIKQPGLADRPARPHEPYGVAELFKSVLWSARAFNEQRDRAHHRLHVAVMSLIALIAVMGLLAGGFYLSRPSAEVAALESSLRATLPARTAPAQERLREPVEPRLKELTKVTQDPHFAALPIKLQEDVRLAVKEMSAYQEVAGKVDGLKLVRLLKSDDDLESNGREADKIVMPADFEGTRIAWKFQQYKSQLVALRLALSAEKDWLKKQIDEGDKLRRMAIPAEGSAERQTWITRANAFLKEKGKDPAKDVPDVPNMKLRQLYEFPSVNSLRASYDAVRQSVDKIRGGLL